MGAIINPFLVATTPPSLSYIDSATITTNGSSFTFSSESLGTAGNRWIIVGIAANCVSVSGGSAISSVTIGGITATIAKEQRGGSPGTDATAALAIAYVPTGTTGDIVVTFAASYGTCSITWWAAYDLTSITAVATASSTADPSALNVNTAVGDLVAACVCSMNSVTVTWTGVTERADFLSETQCCGVGDHTATTAETPRTVSGDFSATSAFKAGVSAVWR